MPKEKKLNARDGVQSGKAAKYITSKINFKNILQSISQEENISYFYGSFFQKNQIYKYSI